MCLHIDCYYDQVLILDLIQSASLYQYHEVEHQLEFVARDTRLSWPVGMDAVCCDQRDCL